MNQRTVPSPQDPAACSQELLSALVARLQDGRQPAVLRATCAAYAASFLARASFVPDGLVVQALQVRMRLVLTWVVPALPSIDLLLRTS